MATAGESTPETGVFCAHGNQVGKSSPVIAASTDGGGVSYICDLCEEDKRAKYHCIECNQHLCDWCNKIHSRTKPAFGHSVVDINLWDKYQTEVRCNNHPVCPAHPHKVYHYNILCTNCMEIVCGTCRKDLRHPSRIPPIIGLPELSPEEKQLQELYLQLEYYKEVEKLILLDQGVDTNKEPDRPMMADKVKEFMKKFTDRIDKVRKEMISQVNTQFEEEKQVDLEYTYREKIDALEDKIEAYNQKLFDHSRAKYITAAQEMGVDLGPGYREKDLEKIKERSSLPYQSPSSENLKVTERKDEEEKDGKTVEGNKEEVKNKPKRRCKSPVFEPGELDESKIKEMIQEYILQGETPDLIARQDALIREMFGKLEYEIIEEGEDGTQEITKVSNLGRDIRVETKEDCKVPKENAESESVLDSRTEEDKSNDKVVISGGDTMKNKDSAMQSKPFSENGLMENDQEQKKKPETESKSVDFDPNTEVAPESTSDKCTASNIVPDTVPENNPLENDSDHFDGESAREWVPPHQTELSSSDTKSLKENSDLVDRHEGGEKLVHQI